MKNSGGTRTRNGYTREKSSSAKGVATTESEVRRIMQSNKQDALLRNIDKASFGTQTFKDVDSLLKRMQDYGHANNAPMDFATVVRYSNIQVFISQAQRNEDAKVQEIDKSAFTTAEQRAKFEKNSNTAKNLTERYKTLKKSFFKGTKYIDID